MIRSYATGRREWPYAWADLGGSTLNVDRTRESNDAAGNIVPSAHVRYGLWGSPIAYLTVTHAGDPAAYEMCDGVMLHGYDPGPLLDYLAEAYGGAWWDVLAAYLAALREGVA